ncbi:MAG: RHS repeat-associated core domain-containing protein [Kofleriaceae bacterium]
MPARRDYVYDAHYRLTRATGRVHQALLERDHIPGIGSIKGTRHLDLNNGAALETFVRTYDYDLGNNLHTIRHTGASRTWVTALQISATSNRAVPTVDPNGIPISAVDAAARFDAVGNLLRLDHLRQIRWSWRGSLAHAVLIERGDGTNDSEGYAYGADGLRVRKVSERVVHGGQIETIEKVYLGDAERKRILRDGAVIFERWTTHVSDGTGRVALVHRWVQDDLELETSDLTQPRIHYQLSTHQGSSALELDAAGEILSYEEYFPYGGTAFIAGDRARGVDLKEYRYSGKERDEATGLYDYGYRYYAPWIARWLSPDPIGPEDDLNLYQFVLGDPVGNVDEDGLETKQGGLRQAPRDLPPDNELKDGHIWYPVAVQVLDMRNGRVVSVRIGWTQITEAEAAARGIVVYTPVYSNSADTGGSGADREGAGVRQGDGGGAEASPGGVKPGPDAGSQGLGAQESGGDGGGGSGTKGAGGTGHGEGAVGTGGQSEAGDGQGTQSQAAVGNAPGDGTGASSNSIGGGTGINPGSGSGSGSVGNGGTGTSAGGGAGPGRGAGTGGTSSGGGTGGTGKGPGGGLRGAGRGAAGGGVGEGIGAGYGSADGSGTGTGAGLDLGSGSRDGGASGFGNPALLSLGVGDGAQSNMSTAGSGSTALASGLASAGGGVSNMSTGGAPGRHGLGRATQSSGGIPGGSGFVDDSMFDVSDVSGDADGGDRATSGGGVEGDGDGSGDKHTGRPGGVRGGSTHPDANPEAGRSDGRPGGAPVDTSGPVGTDPAPRGVWGTIVRWSGYANLEFGDSNGRGQRGGVPGGTGTVNLGWFGQALYVAFTIVSWIGPMAAFKAVSTGFRLATRGLGLLMRLGARTITALSQIPFKLTRWKIWRLALRELLTRRRALPEEMVTLYRGVNLNHAHYAESAIGIVRPNRRWWELWRPKSTPEIHNTGHLGTLNSPYTSWTTNPEVAKNYAVRKAVGADDLADGVVITVQVPKSRIVRSPDVHPVGLVQAGVFVPESEVLLKGVVRGHVTIVKVSELVK